MRRKTTYKLAKTWSAILFCIAYFTIASSQAQVLSNLQNSFNVYQKDNLQEKVYVHINKSSFLTGEIIWFKIYCVDGSTNKLLDLSKVAYVELLDVNHAAVLQAKIGLNHGTGNGSLYIPFSVNTGNYRVRAYTNWMKNFDADYFFESQVTIINPLRTLPANKQTAIAYDIQFFPEGGHLVKGISSKIAFKLTGNDGKGADCSGAVIDQKNDTVARFKSLKFGIGSFTFKPQAQMVYKAVIRVNNNVITKELPQISESGYVMQTTSHEENWKVSIKSSDSISAAGIYLIVHNNHNIKIAEGVKLVNGNASFNIYKSKLDDGINYVTLFDDQQRPLCERLIFKRPFKKLMINVRADQPGYNVRKKVNLTISTQDQERKNLAANLSVSVFRADAFQNVNADHVAGYMWLHADLKGAVESPDFYLDNINQNADEALDNLMLSQGWTQFDWTKALSGTTPHFKFLPEYTGPIVAGRIANTRDNTQAKGITTYLTIPGPPNELYITTSDSTGRLLFNAQKFYGSKEIVIQTNSLQDSTYHIEVTNPFSDQHSTNPLNTFTTNTDIKTVLAENSVNMQVQNIFTANKLKQFYDPQIDSTLFFGKPSKTYLLDNFTRFPTVEEVLREYVGSIAVAKRQGKFTVKMYNVDKPLGNPLILFDGDPIFDADKIFKIDPLKIKRLDVVNTNYLYGPAFFNGIMSFTTYKNDGVNFDIDPHAVVLDYEGLQFERKFYSPVYDTESQTNSTIPDFRNTLYWNPNADTRSDGKINLQFYTSDKAGHYIGIVEGITDNGEAGYQSFNFEVKK